MKYYIKIENNYYPVSYLAEDGMINTPTGKKDVYSNIWLNSVKVKDLFIDEDRDIYAPILFFIDKQTPKKLGYVIFGNLNSLLKGFSLPNDILFGIKPLTLDEI